MPHTKAPSVLWDALRRGVCTCEKSLPEWPTVWPASAVHAESGAVRGTLNAFPRAAPPVTMMTIVTVSETLSVQSLMQEKAQTRPT